MLSDLENKYKRIFGDFADKDVYGLFDYNLRESGNRGTRECHITPDWLLIYEIANDELILYLTRTGTHSALF